MNHAGCCTFCNKNCLAELRCSQCGYLCHYDCALGFSPVEEFKSSALTEKFVCAPCIVGSSYNLIHMALDAHRMHGSHSRSVSMASDAPSHGSAHISPIPGNMSIHRLRDDSQEVINSHRLTGAADSTPLRIRPGPPVAHSSSSPDTSASAHNRAIQGETGRSNNIPSTTAYIHPSCEAKAKKLLLGLNNTKTIPKHATTLLLADSLAHCVNKHDFDCSDTLRVRSVGGLCVAAFVRALKQRERPLGSVKRLILSLGVNDYLHREKHCAEESNDLFRAMGREAKRVFPNASVYFVLPYKGITKVTDEDMNELQKLVKTNCRKFRVFTPPSLVNMVSPGGVHPRKQGAKLLTEFYRKLVPVPQRPFSRDSGRQSQYPSYSAAAQQHPPPQTLQQRQAPVSNNPAYLGQPGPSSNAAPPTRHVLPGSRDDNHNLAWDIASSVVCALQQRDYRLMYPK